MVLGRNGSQQGEGAEFFDDEFLMFTGFLKNDVEDDIQLLIQQHVIKLGNRTAGQGQGYIGVGLPELTNKRQEACMFDAFGKAYADGSSKACGRSLRIGEGFFNFGNDSLRFLHKGFASCGQFYMVLAALSMTAAMVT